jgi:hypothetical protein
MDTELMLNGAKAALQCTDDACSYPRGMPVHSHDGAEGLKPEWVRQSAQELIAAVLVDNSLGDYRSEPRHSVPQPMRHSATMEREISASGTTSH